MSDVNTAPRGNSPAFPCQDNKKQIWTGMNLRDYIAMEAMHAIIDSGNYDLEVDGSGWQDDRSINAKDVAERSYLIATAMLDEREKFR